MMDKEGDNFKNRNARWSVDASYVFSPNCTLGKEILQSTECSKTLYKYKGCVKIPPISFVDDCLTVTNCGPNSVKMNAYVQSKAETKKLELREAVQNILRGGVYEIGRLRPLDAYPPHFFPQPSTLPPFFAAT